MHQALQPDNDVAITAVRQGGYGVDLLAGETAGNIAVTKVMLKGSGECKPSEDCLFAIFFQLVDGRLLGKCRSWNFSEQLAVQ